MRWASGGMCTCLWKHQTHVHGDTDTHTPSIQPRRLLSTSVQYVYLNFLLTEWQNPRTNGADFNFQTLQEFMKPKWTVHLKRFTVDRMAGFLPEQNRVCFQNLTEGTKVTSSREAVFLLSESVPVIYLGMTTAANDIYNWLCSSLLGAGPWDQIQLL